MAKELISRNEYGLFANSEGTVMIDSRDVARAFDKAKQRCFNLNIMVRTPRSFSSVG